MLKLGEIKNKASDLSESMMTSIKDRVSLKVSQVLAKLNNKEKVNLIYNALFNANGFTNPKAYIGSFNDGDIGGLQKKLYTMLLDDEGFKRQLFQIVFEGQRAGVTKEIDLDGYDEAHVRFYNNGVISCELEQGRFGDNHWEGYRTSGQEYLFEIIERNLHHFSKEEIIMLSSLVEGENKDEYLCDVDNILKNPTFVFFLATVVLGTNQALYQILGFSVIEVTFAILIVLFGKLGYSSKDIFMKKA